MNLKESVDKYIGRHFKSITKLKGQKGFKWSVVALRMKKEDPTVDKKSDKELGEYMRGRFRVFQDKVLEEVVERTNISTTGNQPFCLQFKENRDKGTAELTDKVSKKLDDKEIYEKYNVDQSKYKISQIWYKDSSSGYNMSVLFTAIKTEEETVDKDYKSEFEKFINSYNMSVINKDFEYLKHEIPDNKTKENALIISLSDLHLDVKTYESETGHDSNMHSASKRAMDAVRDIIYRATYGHGINQIIIIGGNDFYHANNAKGTTEKGTPLDVDGRFHESFNVGLQLITNIIDLAKAYAPVKYYTCYGNHSPEREFYLATAIKAFYRNDSQVYVENEPSTRKYFSYGNSAFMLSHDAPKNIKDSPLVFATEKPELFTFKYKFLLTGHLHSKQETFFMGTKENFGLVWKRLPSLSKSDKWHTDSFFIGNQKSAIGLVINKNHGEIAEYIYNE